MWRFPIICSGGIGDSLLKLARVPVAPWGRCGVRFNIFYDGKEHPAWQVLRDFFPAIKYCNLLSRPPKAAEYRMRNVFERIHENCQTLHAPPLPSNHSRLTLEKESRGILVQTHLDGHHGHAHLTAKVWSIDRWCDFFWRFQERGWGVDLLEWNDAAVDTIRERCPFIRDARKFTLLETIQSIREARCLVSVDSWTKYVAAWWKIPQVVIVPDLRNGYTPSFSGIPAPVVASRWFRGLTDSPTTHIIGLEKINGNYSYTLNSISELEVAQLNDAVESICE